MRLLLTALACLISVSVFGQGWEQTYGGEGSDVGNSVQQTTDGGYIIAGITKSFGAGNEDVYLIKTDENGVEQWSRTFGGISHDGGISVQQTTDGGYIIAGITKSFGAGNEDVYLIKTDENGVEQWSRTFGGISHDGGISVQQTTDGGYIVTGSTYSFGAGSSDVYLIKTDENGNELWTKTFGGTEGDNGRSVQQTFDGGYIVTGSTSSFGAGSSDVYLIKTDGNGNEQWSQTFGGEENNDGFSVQQTTDGGYIIVGMSYTWDSYMDVYLIKTNFNGIEQWSQVLGGLGDEWAYSGQQTTDGGYIITGYIHAAGHGLYLLKTNENGEEQWNRIFGEASKQSYALGYSVQQTTDGGYIITGCDALSPSGSGNVYLIKTNSEGTILSEFTIPTPSPKKLEKVVDALGREVNHTTNQILFHIYDNGSVEKKFIIE